LQLYYNNKLLKLRFISASASKKKADTSSAAASAASTVKPTNVYIGQLHNFAIQSIVNITLNTIKEQETKAGDIIVDIDMDEVFYKVDGGAGGNDFNTHTEATESFVEDDSDEYETDSGEESQHEDDEDQVAATPATPAKANDGGNEDDDDD